MLTHFCYSAINATVLKIIEMHTNLDITNSVTSQSLGAQEFCESQYYV